MKRIVGRHIFATAAPSLVLGGLIILNGAGEASAMSLFKHDSPAAPQQTLHNSTTNNSNGTNGSINASPVTVLPEPSSIVLLASGLLGLGVWRLRRKP